MSDFMGWLMIYSVVGTIVFFTAVYPFIIWFMG